MSIQLSDLLYGPLPWHLLLILAASLQQLIRRLLSASTKEITMWDIGSWCVIFLTGFVPLFADLFWWAWLQYLIFTPILFFFGFWFSESVLGVRYNEGAIAHLFAVNIYIGMLVVSAVIKFVLVIVASAFNL